MVWHSTHILKLGDRPSIHYHFYLFIVNHEFYVPKPNAFDESPLPGFSVAGRPCPQRSIRQLDLDWLSEANGTPSRIDIGEFTLAQSFRFLKGAPFSGWFTGEPKCKPFCSPLFSHNPRSSSVPRSSEWSSCMTTASLFSTPLLRVCQGSKRSCGGKLGGWASGTSVFRVTTFCESVSK